MSKDKKSGGNISDKADKRYSELNDKMTREQWILTNQMSSAVQCMNTLFCADGDDGSSEENRNPEYIDTIIEGIACLCDTSALGDSAHVLQKAYSFRASLRDEHDC